MFRKCSRYVFCRWTQSELNGGIIRYQIETNLNVAFSFRGQGLAKKLLQRSEELAREHNFEMMKTDATGLFSQKISSALGFRTCSEIRYDDYSQLTGFPAVEFPHEKLMIMYKSLAD